LARVTPPAAADEITVLRAKAAVCDAYRRWLASTSHRHRAEVSAALAELSRIEGHDA
jgi:hypothetical protein